jgi:Lrp/AsnC family leucine-responsive transcriptional regulator
LSSKAAPLSGLLEVTKPVAKTVSLDSTDRRLLTLLAADARVSQRKLAAELRMSPPAVGERIARLERAGVIRGYTIDIDWTALGCSVVYLTVAATPGAAPEVVRGLYAIPEVEDVVVITGSFDLLARLRVRDHEHLRRVLMSEIWKIDGLQRTETFLGLGEMHDKRQYVGDVLDRLAAVAAAEEEKAPEPSRAVKRRRAGS